MNENDNIAQTDNSDGKIAEELNKIVPNDKLDSVWGNANFFGVTDKREVIKYGLLKCAIGYCQGYTSQTILEELGLITSKYKITKKGREYLWVAFSDNSNF